MKALQGDPCALGRAYHELFMGTDTDESEAAARHFGEMVELVRRSLKG